MSKLHQTGTIQQRLQAKIEHLLDGNKMYKRLRLKINTISLLSFNK
jgi:hypothetical protein